MPLDLALLVSVGAMLGVSICGQIAYNDQ